MGSIAGQAIKGYELKELVAQGGFGAVYRAVQTGVGREVAIKVILPEFSSQPEFILRFENEAQLVAHLEHPHIVPLYDYWREPEGAYLVMRWYPGGSLRRELQRGPLDLDRIAGVMGQISAALSFAHQRNVVHRDIKPDNILLDIEKNAYLSDFGIAKALHRETGLTIEGKSPFTLAYVSPEQALGKPVSPQSDIYCLGVVLYEMAKGEHPFPGLNPVQQLMRHINEPLPALTTAAGGSLEALDAVIQKATSKSPSDRFGSALEMQAALRTALQEAHPSRMVAPTIGAERHNPYKGLRAFQEADSADFFGRETLVDQLIRELDPSVHLYRFLAVVGPSGSGKSSLVKAGLVPALRSGRSPGSQNWYIVTMQPGSHPLEELEIGLLGVAVDRGAGLREHLERDERGLLRASRLALPNSESELLLVIDQFEELFTLVQSEHERSHFLNLLVSAATDSSSRVRILVTIRADFYDRPLMVRGFSELIRDRTLAVVPLSTDELASAILSPARAAGVEIEPQLASTLVAEVQDQPGALPLLQYALTELFEHRSEGLITSRSYRSIGGVLGALGQRAEAVFTLLDGEAQAAARQIFLRMVTLGEGTEDTRRRVLRSEIESVSPTPNSAQRVIQIFGASRLLTFDHDPSTRAPTVEVAHEALIKQWQRFHDWVDQSRVDLRLQRLLAVAAAEWSEADRDSGYLMRGSRLDQFEAWSARSDVALALGEREFLAASLEARRLRHAEEARRQAREAALERRSRLILRALVGVFGLTAAISLGLFGAARRAQQEAQAEAVARSTQQAIALGEALARGTQQMLAVTESRRAEIEAQLSSSRELAAAALRTLESDPQLGLLLALQAVDAGRTVEGSALREVVDALHVAVQANAPRLIQSFATGDGQLYVVAFDPAGERLMTYGSSVDEPIWQANRQTRIWDASTGQLDLELPGFPASDEWSDDSWLATVDRLGGETIGLTIWNAETGDRVAEIELGLDIPAEDRSGEVSWQDRDIDSIALSPGGDILSLAVSPGDYVVHVVWNLATGEEILRTSFVGTGAVGRTVTAVSFSPEGHRLAVGTADGDLAVWDLVAGNQLFSAGNGRGTIRDIAFDRNGELLGASFTCYIEPGQPEGAACPEGVPVRVWEVATGQELTSRFILDDELWAVALGPGATTLATGGADGIARIWAVDSGQVRLELSGHGKAVSHVAFRPDGPTLASVSLDGRVRLWDIREATGIEKLLFGQDTGMLAPSHLPISASPANPRLATSRLDGTVELWDTDTGELMSSLAGWGSPVVRLAFVDAGQALATLDQAGVFRWHSPVEPGAEVVIGGFDGCCFAVSLDASTLAISAGPSAIDIYDLARLVAGGEPSEAVRSSIQLTSLGELGPPSVVDLAISPAGDLVAVAGPSGGLGAATIFSATTGDPVLVLETPSPAILALSFSMDGSRLAGAAVDGIVTVWDARSWSVVRKLKGHVGPVSRVVFSEDDTRIATAGQDGTARIWDATTGGELLSLFVAAGGSTDVAFSADGTEIYASGVDGVTRAYLLDLAELISLAEARVTRSLTPDECERYLRLARCP
jgi:serine/threonine protein kinase/WD40 repeat protein